MRFKSIAVMLLLTAGFSSIEEAGGLRAAETDYQLTITPPRPEQVNGNRQATYTFSVTVVRPDPPSVSTRICIVETGDWEFTGSGASFPSASIDLGMFTARQTKTATATVHAKSSYQGIRNVTFVVRLGPASCAASNSSTTVVAALVGDQPTTTSPPLSPTPPPSSTPPPSNPAPPSSTGRGTLVPRPLPDPRQRDTMANAGFFDTSLGHVYSHPRCANCHGGITAVTHQPPITSASNCTNSVCHSVSGWKFSTRAFALRTSRQICETVAGSSEAANRESFRVHVTDDALIKWALAPVRIGSKSVLPAAPGGHVAFVANSMRWFDAPINKNCGVTFTTPRP